MQRLDPFLACDPFWLAPRPDPIFTPTVVSRYDPVKTQAVARVLLDSAIEARLGVRIVENEIILALRG